MSNLQISILFGIGVWVLAGVLVSLLMGKRTPSERGRDDWEQLDAVSKPAPLEAERRHVKAGTAYGEPLQ